MRAIITTSLFVVCMAFAAHGAYITYLNDSGVTNLSDVAAWDGGVVPGAEDVAVFDGTLPTVLLVGENTEWYGMVRTNIVNATTFSGEPITLGAGGITCYTENKGFHRTYLQSTVLSAAQTWDLAVNKALYVQGSVTGTGPLTLNAASGANVVFCGAVEPSGGVAVTGGVKIWAMSGSSFAQAPSMATGTHFLFLPDGTGDVSFGDVVTSHSFTNSGVFSFGGADTDSTAAMPDSPVITLTSGDSLIGTDLSNSDRNKQMIRVQDSHVVADGADVTCNSWFNIRSGSWTQLSGDTYFRYGAIVGRGTSTDYVSKMQRLTLAGGSFTARRLSVGVANNDYYPAELFVTGGSYEPVLPNQNDWAGALVVGQRCASGETVWDDVSKTHVNIDNSYASGRMEITDGTVKTPSLRFGNSYYIVGRRDVNTSSRLALRGGTLRVGNTGISPGTYWDANSESHYDCVFSGGTFEYYRNASDSTADIRLSDRDGGTTFYMPDFDDLEMSGSLFGSGGFRKTGPGTLRLTGSNDYTGRTDVVEGALYTGFDAAHSMRAIWDADSFASLDAGTQISTWSNRAGVGTWMFQNAGAIFTGKGYSCPTVADTDMNGHVELAFDGSRAIFLTGNAVQPISEKSAFTMACVLRVDDGAVGGGSGDWQNATVIMGCTIADNTAAGSRYGIALNSSGCIGCGMRTKWKENDASSCNASTNETLWTTTPINDGKPHVVVWSWTFNGNHTLQVDDEVWKCTSVSNGWGKTIKTRFIIGAGEESPANTFQGTLASVRMSGVAMDAAECAEYARGLGLRYGVEAFTAPSYSAPSASTETVPEATATWDAASLTQSEGESVSSWPEKDGKGYSSSTTWTFTTSLADTILSGWGGYAGSTESPKIVYGPDGHKLVSFNGTNTCMALTGSKDTPIGNASSMSVAAVVRFTGYGSGGGEFSSAGTTTGFLGESFSPKTRQWLLTLTGSARVGACMEWSSKSGTATARSARRFLNDGELHVLVVSYPENGQEGTVVFALDGVTNSVVCTPANTIAKTRILLGGAEQNSVARYAPVDVAELSLWNTALTPGQVETLSRELCAKYGVYAEGYERWASDGRQRSKEIFVHEGASYGAKYNENFTIFNGQTVWGDGSLVGRMTVEDGAAVKVTATNSLTSGDVEFLDGSALKVECDSNGSVTPLAVEGDLVLHDGTLTVELSGGKLPPVGTALITWTGNLETRGTTVMESTGASSSLQYRLDLKNKRLVVASPSGTMLIVR